LKSEQAKSSTASDEPGLNIFPIQYENTPAPDSFLVSRMFIITLDLCPTPC
jgi:hypothetical protein